MLNIVALMGRLTHTPGAEDHPERHQRVQLQHCG